MHVRAKTILTYFALIIVSLYFLFYGLVQAKSFLAPLSIAALLAMVMLPVCRWLESKGLQRGWAALFSDLIILLFFVLLAWVVSAQVNRLAEDWPQIKEKLAPKIEQLQQFVANQTGLSMQEINQKIPGEPSSGEGNTSGQSGGEESKQQQPSGGHSEDNQQQGSSQQPSSQGEPPQGKPQGKSSSFSLGGSGSSLMSTAGSFVTQFFSFLGSFLLTFVYIFFFLLYRTKFREALLKMVPEDRKDIGRKVIGESAKTSQNYLFGRLILIIFLAVLYSVGLVISGIKQAILISLLAAVLSLVPYIGNIIGFVLATGMALFSGSGALGVLGVSITFTVAQFVESYILEPYIVGDKVNLNPIFTIIVVVLGGAIWGVMGMLIAIPTLGIIKVVFDHIPALQPLGYLFGDKENKEQQDDGDNIFKRTKRWALHKFR